jgi:hypothetical protein
MAQFISVVDRRNPDGREFVNLDHVALATVHRDGTLFLWIAGTGNGAGERVGVEIDAENAKPVIELLGKTA